MTATTMDSIPQPTSSSARLPLDGANRRGRTAVNHPLRTARSAAGLGLRPKSTAAASAACERAHAYARQRSNRRLSCDVGPRGRENLPMADQAAVSTIERQASDAVLLPPARQTAEPAGSDRLPAPASLRVGNTISPTQLRR